MSRPGRPRRRVGRCRGRRGRRRGRVGRSRGWWPAAGWPRASAGIGGGRGWGGGAFGCRCGSAVASVGAWLAWRWWAGKVTGGIRDGQFGAWGRRLGPRRSPCRPCDSRGWLVNCQSHATQGGPLRACSPPHDRRPRARQLHPPSGHAGHGSQPSGHRHGGGALRRRERTASPRPPRLPGGGAVLGAHHLGTRAAHGPSRTHGAPRRGPLPPHAPGRLRRPAAVRSLDGAVALPRVRRRGPRGGAPAHREPLPRRRSHRGLPADSSAQGAANAARQPAHRRRRGAWQDGRGRPDPHRAAPPAPHPPRARSHAGRAARPVEGGAVGEVLAALRGDRPPGHGTPPSQARHRRQPLALLQPHHRVLPLPAAAGRAGAVPLGQPDVRRVPPSPVGPPDRGRVPQPHARALRRGQPPLPDAPGRGPPLRAPSLPLGNPAQRPHPLVHWAAGDPRPGALQPHQRDEPGDAAPRERSRHPQAQARHQRRFLRAALLHPQVPPRADPSPGIPARPS